ncbi:hypothetical protein ACVIIV_005200 [Bradyrhizobium sp. USDA 4354]
MRAVAGLTAGILVLVAGPAYVEARAYPMRAFDGAWHLTFQTRAGSCDPNYEFDVNILNGNITHPNLVRFHGRVSPSGAVRASVTVQDKHATGRGRLQPTHGVGSWSGYSGSARCSGTWSARKV